MKSTLTKNNLIFGFGFLVFLIPSLVGAQDTITTFQTIPYVDGPVLNTETYIEMLYRLSIAVAAFLVVFKIILAGARLTISDSVSGRSKAKEDIQGALLGMLIILGAVTILNTINPNLSNLNALKNAQPTVINNTSFPTSSQVMSAEKKRVLDEGLSVASVYRGDFGVTIHLNFIKDCKLSGGTAIGDAINKLVECYK